MELVRRGRIADVLKGYDESLNRPVAIKLLHPELARDEGHVARFRAEAAGAARLVHPNVVPIYFIGQDGDLYFIVMQWVEGESLAQRLSEHGRLEPDEALEILKQCLLGLRVAHASGMVHGRVTAGNILLERGTGRAMLVDFGMARVAPQSTDRAALGEPAQAETFIALKAIAGALQDSRVDLFWLGVTAHQMLSGRMPPAMQTTTTNRVDEPACRPALLQQAVPDVSERLAELVTRMVASRQEDRYQTADEVLADLWQLEGGQPADALAPVEVSIRGLRSIDLGPDPQLPPSTARWLRPNWWQAVKQRARSLFWAHAPHVVTQLQTTAQHVDAAVAEYRRRRDALAQVIDEGEGICKELASRKESLLHAAADAALRVQSAASGSDLAEARRSLEHSRQSVAELTAQANRLEEQLADLRVKKAQVGARLLELANQRDLLEARLQRARAGLRPERPRALRTATALGVLVGLILVTVAASYAVYRCFSPAGKAATSTATSLEAGATDLPPENSESSGPAVPDFPEASVGVESGSSPVVLTDPLTASVPDLSAYPPATVTTFDGPPPPYVLSFSGKQCVQFDISEYDWDWMSRNYTVVLAVRFRPCDRPCRLMGNLDTRPGQPLKGGWALFLFPADTAAGSEGADEEVAADPGKVASAEETGVDPDERVGAAEARLALAYVASDGRIQQLVGPPFVPGDRWWRITVSHPWRGDQIMIHLGGKVYHEASPRGMIDKPWSSQFWLGCPEFAEEEFSGDIGGFAFHYQEYGSAPRFSLGQDTMTLFRFDSARAGQVLDFSGRGLHGSLLGGCQWVRLPRRPLRPNQTRKPSVGKAFALRLRRAAIVELLGTRGVADLDDTFTAEMWVRGLKSGSTLTLLGDGVAPSRVDGVFCYAGWHLKLSRESRSGDALAIAYPLRPGRYGYLRAGLPPIDLDRWHHLAFCNTSGRRQVYLDGKPLIRDETDQAQAILDHGGPSPRNLVIGNRDWGDGERHDELRAFRLSSSRRYDGPFTPPPEFTNDKHTLVLLDLSQATSDPIVSDASGNGRHGLMVLVSWVEVDRTWGQ